MKIFAITILILLSSLVMAVTDNTVVTNNATVGTPITTVTPSGVTNMPNATPIGVVDPGHGPENLPSRGTPGTVPGSPGLAVHRQGNASETGQAVPEMYNGSREVVAHRQGLMEVQRSRVQAVKTEMAEVQAHQIKATAMTLRRVSSLMDSANLSDVINHFNRSAESMEQAEEKLQRRSGFARFFAGGDHKVAGQIEDQLVQNTHKIQMLRNVKQQECTDCDESLKGLISEQIQEMEQEQVRLQAVADDEKESKGLFGWLWKWG